MSVLVKQVEEKLSALITEAAQRAMESGELPQAELGAFKVEVPANRDNGDYSTNAAMAWARLFPKAPRQIAEILAAEFVFDGTYVEKCEIAGPGFINFFLSICYFFFTIFYFLFSLI